MEKIKPRNIAVGLGLGAVAVLGLGEGVDYFAHRAGTEAGNSFIDTVEESDVGQQKVAELKDLLSDEFTADWLAEQLSKEGVDGQWLIETVIGGGDE